MKFRVEFDNQGWAEYLLTDTTTTRQWANLIDNAATSNVCKNNTRMGQASPKEMQERCSRLDELARILHSANSTVWLPSHPITTDTVSACLEPMHQHFPEMYKDPNFVHLRTVLDEYNDTIHWIETAIRSPVGIDLKIDFKDCEPIIPIPAEDVVHFQSGWPAGSITLHYAQTGRHAAEMFWNNDTTSPVEQWIPQTRHSPSCYLRFRARRTISSIDWSRYWFQKGGLQYWGIGPRDPELRLGYIVLGHLVESHNLDLHSEIINWRVIK